MYFQTHERMQCFWLLYTQNVNENVSLIMKPKCITENMYETLQVISDPFNLDKLVVYFTGMIAVLNGTVI